MTSFEALMLHKLGELQFDFICAGGLLNKEQLIWLIDVLGLFCNQPLLLCFYFVAILFFYGSIKNLRHTS